MTTQVPILPTTDPVFPKAEGYGALIGTRWFRLAPTPDQSVRYYTRDSLAERSDDSGSTYNNVLDIGYSWARGDVSGGEGLDFDPRYISLLDEQRAQDIIRYWDSDNIDIGRVVRGTVARAALSKRFEIWRNQVTLADLATSDTYLFIAYGSTLEWWDNWEDVAPTGAVGTVSGNDIVQIEASGLGDVAVLLDNGTLEYFDTSTELLTVVPGLTNVQSIWFAKGRFIAYINDGSDNSQLIEFDAGGVFTAGPFDTFRGECFSLVSSGPAVVAAISDGTLRSYVPEQSNQLDPTSVTLVVQGVTETPEGEIPFLLGSNADILIFLTRTTGEDVSNDVRLYQAVVLDSRFSYVVGQMQLRREWNDISTSENPLKNMATTRDEIWFIIEESATTKSTWRFDLVTFGLSRHRTEAITPEAHSIVIFDERGAFVSGGDIWRVSDIYADDGWIIGPNINFGLNTDINWVAAVFTASNLSRSGKQVELYYSTDIDAILDPEHSSWALAVRASSEPQQEAEAFLQGVTSRTLALMLRIYSSEADTRTPAVTNWAIRGLPAHRDWILELPINVSDVVETSGRRPVRIPTFGDVLHKEVTNLLGDSVRVNVLDPPVRFQGVVDSILEPTTYISDRGGVSVRAVVQLRGEFTDETQSPTGDAGLGLGLLGVIKLGVGQTERT